MKPDCPECGRLLEAPFKSCACGWGAQKKRDACPFQFGVKIADEWIDRRCAFNDHGYRCGSEGWMSQATNGMGPWYCGKHFFEMMKMAPLKENREAYDKHIGALLDLVQGREPGEDEREAA